MRSCPGREAFLIPALVVLCGVFLTAGLAWGRTAYPVVFFDARGKEVRITKRPARVVSLVPSATEIVLALDSGDVLKGVTYHDGPVAGPGGAAIVGGFLRPSVERIRELEPDLVICSGLQEDRLAPLENSGLTLMGVETEGLEESFEDIALLGRILDREDRARGLVQGIRGQLLLVEEKVSRIPADKRRRVIRLMGRDRVMTPGSDSFQNQMIRAAGGVPHGFDGEGPVIPVALDDWIEFNPQVIYGCGADRETARKWLERPGWEDVEAVQKGRIFYFPCELACRAATRTGDFVSWLASRTYPEEFARDQCRVERDRVLGERTLDLPLDYVDRARVVTSRILDFENKTLVIDFKEPLQVLSTLDGERTGVTAVGNHYTSPPGWALSHGLGARGVRDAVCRVLDRSPETSAFLLTGADMDHLSLQEKSFRDMTVVALVTAGVKSNALRMSRDAGGYYEPGTINTILMTNTRLTPRAMSRAVITATEAKTAALQDLDIRSSADPGFHQATGTGTDNVLVVQGRGPEIDLAGGHSKMGELISSVVYRGVREAVSRQNRIRQHRTIFERLEERGVSLYGLAAPCQCERSARPRVLELLEETLLDPRYASFVELAFAVSDDAQRGLIRDLSPFESLCRSVAEDIARRPVGDLEDLAGGDNLPEALSMALNALLNGVYLRQEGDRGETE